MTCKWIWVLAVISAGWQDARAQNIEHEKDGTLSASMGIKQTQLSLMATETRALAPHLVYQPNVGSMAFVAASYRRYSASLGLDQAPAEHDPRTHGQTRANDYQIRFHGDRWSPEFFYQSYQGYYLENTEQARVTPQNAGGKYLRPDMKFTHWGAQLYYNLNPDEYSFSSHFSLKSHQIESGGSLFLIGAYNFYHLRGDRPLFPEGVGDYGGAAGVNEIRLHSTSLGAAAAYNFVYRGYFLGGMLGFGLNHQIGENRSATADTDEFERTGYKTYVKLGLGYNGRYFYSGVTLNYDGQNTSVASTDVTIDSSEIKIFIGWRFEDMRIGWVDDVDRKVDRTIAGFFQTGP